MNISSSRINFSTIPFQVKKLVKTIHERTKNRFSSEITSVKNTPISLNEKFKIGKDSPIEFALPQKIKKFFHPKDKNTLNKTLITVKNITDTNNTCKKNISAEDVSKITTAFMHKNIANQSRDYNYRVTGAAPLPGGVSVSANNRPTVSEARTPPVSPSLSLQATSSPSSPAEWAKKLTDAVLRQKAGETLSTTELDFSGADFRYILFSEILPSSFMERDGDILKGFNFSNSNFAHSDISDLHFDECRFTYSTLRGAICSNTKFSHSDMNNAFLQYSVFTQQQPSFINTTLKNTCMHHKANLSGVILNEPDNSSPPSKSGGGDFIRLGDIWIQMPLLWTENAVDGFLNHEHNDGKSILMTIDSLPDKYSQEKVRAMEDLVKSLRSGCLSEAHIRPVESSLVSVLAHPPYTQSVLISEWLRPVKESFFAHQCQTYNDVPLPAPDTYHQQRILPVLLDSFDRNSAAMTTHSGFFNQVIVHCMTGVDCTDDIRQKAAALYERYLAHPLVSPHINNGLFGDYDGSPDWTTSAADNFLLLSSRASDTAMMLSADTLSTMLNPKPDTAWDRFYLLRGGENVSTAQISPEELFRHDFPVFHTAFNQQAQQRRFGQLIDTILSSEEHRELNQQFIAATKQKYSDVKFVDAPSQSRLNAVFESLLPEGKLSPPHYQHILNAYHLTDATPQKQAETLFCLSTAFARYSSSAIFGTEHDSPTILRGYAEALMQKAYELSPEIFPSVDKLTDWSNRFHGLHNAFTCTSIVAYDMQRHAREHFPGVLSSILPLAWA
ncbi:type III secretion system effector HECT-type E3 ubiquitin transferase [Salmonella bongori]|uniref:E3 ubiquitin-protein ligase SopA n=3 Tax=Salmonella bongori TaxID=54736 RepID=A0A0K0H8V0_SALBC|nr:type III secretion system effector HECT-type E3 ubiquitin transferase [Salmonella bongori]ASG55199.1 E3 ubiquitin--protein ligase [Salmonella bongori serovar 66:z41:- str. SA19983605]ECC9754158.1 type III secretion system effector HECT-type E3 ubiquitin transferase [Salmonella bongori]EDP8564664.1 type III secretion system effector HECT-type E3 ubiquitin transferase [Salmonella bongori]EDP8608528.1 type III secretion system effector HECT-type E3 ubiquitin transferase [Salmonella bongori]EDP